MPDRIQLLPDSVANQIAAGEVIQRPASVVKELVENAVDAGADDIKIFIKDAGRTLIQVIDNGIGMSETDARMAFERHATSKIRKADDLFSLCTMGFRGEALPSICAISQVELRSRQKDAPMGTRLIINGSRVESQKPDLCDQGTNIMVKNLFYNVPARRKFLKSDNVELGNIMREFERLALVNPGVRMSIDTGGKLIDLRKANLRMRISDLWKGSLGQQLIPIEAETAEVRISGFVTRPEFARRRNPLQYFFVNGRNMRHPYFHKAVINSFTGLIAPETMPCYFIKFEVDPAKIDVNIHPTKNEIKFEDEMLIWSVLAAAVKASLGKHAAVPSIDFDSELLPVEPINDPNIENKKPEFDIPLDYNPFTAAATSTTADRQADPAYPSKGSVPREWESLYSGFMTAKDTRGAVSQGSSPDSEPVGGVVEGPNPFRAAPAAPAQLPGIVDTAPGVCLQFASKYIITTSSRGVIVIDQHRAHLKILFNRFISRFGNDEPITQSLLFPEPLEISPDMAAAFEETRDFLKDLGLVVENEGDSYVITGVPPMTMGISPAELVEKVLDAVSEGSETYGSETPERIADILKSRIALAMARSLAVTRGRRLTTEEMEEMVVQLFSLPDPDFTPSGGRVFTLLDESAIQKLLP